MAALLYLCLAISGCLLQDSPAEIRVIEYEGKAYRTTYNLGLFNGKYSGTGDGYLELNPDGTGVYVYDVFGMAPKDCIKAPIAMDYGFLVDENNEVIRLKREYGFSYPVLFQSTGSTSFQGCRTPVMLDFLLVYEDGSISVSSSDDWLKQE